MSVTQENAKNIWRGLHQAAQPITVLQGTLELALQTAGGVQEYRYAIKQSLRELQRLTGYFEHLRTLVQLDQTDPDVANQVASSMVKGPSPSVKTSAAPPELADSQPSLMTSRQEQVRTNIGSSSADHKFSGSLSGLPRLLPAATERAVSPCLV